MPDGPTADRAGEWFWGEAVMVGGPAGKDRVGETSRRSLRIGPKVKELMYGAKSELLLLSPYFVPEQGRPRGAGRRWRSAAWR